ncbi:MAG: hypothetical protein AAGG56_06915 [Pseudomonadota bacterium]
MKPIFEEADHYQSAVAQSAQAWITKFGKLAAGKAWDAARMPNLTRSERSYCQAVAIRVTQLVSKESATA